jgi:hypothetical protein
MLQQQPVATLEEHIKLRRLSRRDRIRENSYHLRCRDKQKKSKWAANELTASVVNQGELLSSSLSSQTKKKKASGQPMS